MSLLPVEAAHRLAEQAETCRWLVEGLWSEEAVGIVGGEPKECGELDYVAQDRTTY